MPQEQEKLLSFLHNAAHVCRTPKYDLITIFGVKSVPISAMKCAFKTPRTLSKEWLFVLKLLVQLYKSIISIGESCSLALKMRKSLTQPGIAKKG